MVDILRGLPSMDYKLFDKKTSGSGTKNENISSKYLAEELHKPIIKNVQKQKVHSPFIDNIRGADLADIHLTSKVNKGSCFFMMHLTFSVNTHGLFLWKIKKHYN